MPMRLTPLVPSTCTRSQLPPFVSLCSSIERWSGHQFGRKQVQAAVVVVVARRAGGRVDDLLLPVHLLEHLAGIGNGPVFGGGEVVDRPGVISELWDPVLDQPLMPEDDRVRLATLELHRAEVDVRPAV